jgi:hypothetical protein
MAKLHEVLAVEKARELAATQAMADAVFIFRTPTMFMGELRTTEMFDEAAPVPPEERAALSRRVDDVMTETVKKVAAYYEVMLQKEATNQQAEASLIVDGKPFGTYPATFLLGLESRLRKLREVFVAAPTLQEGVEWVDDDMIGKGVRKYKYPIRKTKTAKTFQYKVLYDATERHPAQIEKWEEQVPVGIIVTHKWAAMWTPAEKVEKLERLDKLIEACVVARQKANETEVKIVGKMDAFLCSYLEL